MRDVLPSIPVPTLLLHRRDDLAIDVRHSRYLAEHIPGARYIELEGRDNLLVVGDSERVIAEVERFLTGTHTPPEPDRVFATVMFTDIVGSTETAARIGDRAWRELLARHGELARGQLARFRGRAVKSLGDGFLATFDGPARAIRCALELREAVRSWGSSCAPAFTPASARRSATTSAGSPCTSVPASARSPHRARCSSRTPSRISSSAPASTSPTAGSTR